MAVGGTYLGVQNTPLSGAIAGLGTQLGQGLTNAWKQDQQHKANIYAGLAAQLSDLLGDQPWITLNEVDKAQPKNPDGSPNYTKRAMAARGLFLQTQIAFDNATGNQRTPQDIMKSMEGAMAKVPSVKELGQSSTTSWLLDKDGAVKPLDELLAAIQKKKDEQDAVEKQPAGGGGATTTKSAPPSAPPSIPTIPEYNPSIGAYTGTHLTPEAKTELVQTDVVTPQLKSAIAGTVLDPENRIFELSQKVKNGTITPNEQAELSQLQSNFMGQRTVQFAGVDNSVPAISITSGNDVPYNPLTGQPVKIKGYNPDGTPIYGYADGGVVSPTPGGTQMNVGGQQAVVGEGKNTEAVLPLSDDVLGKLGAAIGSYVIKAMQGGSNQPSGDSSAPVPTNPQGQPMAKKGMVVKCADGAVIGPKPFRQYLIAHGWTKLDPNGPSSDEDLAKMHKSDWDAYQAELTAQQPSNEPTPTQTPPTITSNNQAAPTTITPPDAGVAPTTTVYNTVDPSMVRDRALEGQANDYFSKQSDLRAKQIQSDLSGLKAGQLKMAQMAQTAKQTLAQKLYVDYPAAGKPTPTTQQIFNDPQYAQLRGEMLKTIDKESQALSAITNDPSFMRANRGELSKMFDKISSMTPEQAAAAGFTDLAQVGMSRRNNDTQKQIALAESAAKMAGMKSISDTLLLQVGATILKDPILACFYQGKFHPDALKDFFASSPGVEQVYNKIAQVAGADPKDSLTIEKVSKWLGLFGGGYNLTRGGGVQAPTATPEANQTNAQINALLQSMLEGK
jgi:hypothetical protein